MPSWMESTLISKEERINIGMTLQSTFQDTENVVRKCT
ncbi:hypothetical protein Goari_019901 [Gossypium aridum]|uniref:Uncharacterized protein n=1 Tax=Gossypium aridum TaxID=34290 RepID=A0A7J8WUH4_GOSAI|nr:hypothetical protein [Gossypium aridum]